MREAQCRATARINLWQALTPKPPWRERKAAHLAHLADPSAVPDDALVVIAADKVHNAQSLLWALRDDGDKTWAVFKGGRDGTVWYYQAMADVLLWRAPASGLVAELCAAAGALAEAAGASDGGSAAARDDDASDAGAL